MRLSDTLTRAPAELPEPPGPVRIYSCGPTVYQRIHVGNAVPFVFAMWLRRWLQGTGYDVQLAINITDINDKIYEAAPGESAELARTRPSGTSRTRAASASVGRTSSRGQPKPCPNRSR